VARPVQNPPLDLVFGNETEFCIKRLPLRCGIQFHGRDVPSVEMLDRFGQKLRTDPLLSEFGIDQNHANPGETALIVNRCGGTDDGTVLLHDETAVRALLEKAMPVGGRLIPTCERVQAQARWKISFTHDANTHNRLPKIVNCV